jgi:hypothetical protein
VVILTHRATVIAQQPAKQPLRGKYRTIMSASYTAPNPNSNTQRKKRRRRIGTFTLEIAMDEHGSRHFRVYFWHGEEERTTVTHMIHHAATDGETVVMFDKSGQFEGYITPTPLKEVMQKAGFFGH